MANAKTIKDIARIAGVGVSTVSRVVNGHRDVNEETREKVMRVIREHNFTPNSNARQLKQTHSNSIAAVIRGANNLFFAPIIEKIQQEAEKTDYKLTLNYIDEYADESAAANRLLAENKVKGILFLGGRAAFSDKGYNLPEEVPCVYLTVDASESTQPNIYSVSVDDRKAAGLAVDALFELGHEKIAVLGGVVEEYSLIGQRRQGIEDSFKFHGISFDEELYFETGFSLAAAYEATKEGLRRRSDFTALFAMSDIMAVGACRALREAGLRIPEDVSVVGFDGIDLVRYFSPSIATVCQPADEIAKTGVRLLMAAINNEHISERHILLPCEYIAGESVKTKDCE